MTLNSSLSLTDLSNNQAEGDSLIVEQLYQYFENQPKSIAVESEQDTSVDFVDLTEEVRQEELNSVTKLNFQLNESFYSALTAGKDNVGANSGRTMHADLLRMSFVINGAKIDYDFILRLCGQYNHLISSHGYRSFATRVFTKMFEHVGAKIPNELILEELVTNCNQAGYEYFICGETLPLFSQCGLALTVPKHEMKLSCHSSNSVDVEYNEDILVKRSDPERKEQYNGSNILKFTLKSQDGEIKYMNGKVTFTIPEVLKQYSANGKNLLSNIEEHFSGKKDEEIVLETPAQSTFTQVQEIADFAIEFTAEAVKEGYEIAKNMLGNAVTGSPKTQEEESMISSFFNDECYEAILPMVFADVKDILDKAKQGDYEKLDAIISSESSGGQLITDLNDENFKNFCSQYLNLDLQREEHENLLCKYRTENIYSVKELMLLAIVANEELTEKYSKDILSNRIFNKKDFIPLLLFICCKNFVQNLSNHIEKIGRNIGLYDRAFAMIEAALSAENTDCVKAMINLLRGTVISSPDSQVIMTPLEFSVQFCPTEVTKVLLEHGIDSGADKALSLAVQRSDLEVVKLLVAEGVIVTDQIMAQAIKISQRCVERDEQSVTENKRKASTGIVQFLTTHFEGSQPARSDSEKGFSPDISDEEVLKKAGNLTTEKNNGNINTEVPVKGFLSNSNNFKELKMFNNNENDIGLSGAIKNVDLKQVQCLIEQKNAIVNQDILDAAEQRLSVLKTSRTKNKNTPKAQQIRNMKEIIEFLKENHNQATDTKSQSFDSGINSASASGQSTPVVDNPDDKTLFEVKECLAAEGKDEEFFDASDGSSLKDEDQQPNVAETKSDDSIKVTQETSHSTFPEAPAGRQPQREISTNPLDSTLSHKAKRKEKRKAQENQSRIGASGNHGDNVVIIHDVTTGPDGKEVLFNERKILGSGEHFTETGDNKKSDASKKSARPYNVAASLFLGGGVGCGVLALSLYCTCAVSVLTLGLVAGVGAFLFIAAAVVHFCKPQTLSEDSNVKQVAPPTLVQGTN